MAALAEHGDQTLQYYMSNSSAVVSAVIASEPAGVIDEDGVVHYSFHMQIDEVLHGPGGWFKKQKRMQIDMTRYETDKKEALPFLKKDEKCILFLSIYATIGVTDPWFGIQPYNSHMANRIKELSKQKKQDRTTKPSTATEEAAP